MFRIVNNKRHPSKQKFVPVGRHFSWRIYRLGICELNCCLCPGLQGGGYTGNSKNRMNNKRVNDKEKKLRYLTVNVFVEQYLTDKLQS